MELLKEKVFTMFCCIFANCNKEYISKFNLKRHIDIIHLKSKETKCDVCQKAFKVQKNLIEHHYIHQNIKPYKCENCGIFFRNRSSFLSHTKRNLCIKG